MAEDADNDSDIVPDAEIQALSSEFSKPEFPFSEELINRNIAYQIRPSLADKFKSHLVKEVIHVVMYDELWGKEYDINQAEMWTKNIVAGVKESSKQLGFKRYKLVIQTILGENKGSGVKIGARCLWDADTDNYASDSFLNDTIFCCVIVFGVYCY